MSDLVPDLSEILDDLYASEINATITWIWDSGMQVALGLAFDQGGYAAEATVRTGAQAAEWLRSEAVRLYPDSDFAEKHRRGDERPSGRRAGGGNSSRAV
jgi:hypothetical protein